MVVKHEVFTREAETSQDFSLVLGGPLYQLLVRSKLIQQPFGNLTGRIGVITALTWLPLLALTIVEGRFAGGVSVPFRSDFELHARLLFSLPLMILAEVVVHSRMRSITAQFVERQIIGDVVRPAFDSAVRSAMRLRNSLPVEVALLLVVALAGPYLWRTTLALNSDTWYATRDAAGVTYTPAGVWYAFFSVPVFQFILLRWYYRILIWCRLLFQVSRLDLNLVATHPDRCGGLGFLGNVAFAFAPLVMAHSGLVAGFIANRVVHEGATLPAYRIELLALMVVLLAILLGPLCVFAPKMNEAKHRGLRDYGRLASAYVVSFSAKWIDGATLCSEPLVGSADIQSLADLDSSFTIVREMRVVPFGKETIVRCLVAIAIPLAPLAFTMFSLQDLLGSLIKVIL